MTQIEKREEGPARGDWLSRWFEFPPSWADWRSRMFEGVEPLRVEEFREGDTLVVKAEMPGLDPEKDVEIDVVDHTLRIRAERRQETKTEEKGGFRSEFHYGSFSRTVPLPSTTSEADVKATYKDGILEVRVPIDQEKAEARTRIPIERV